MITNVLNNTGVVNEYYGLSTDTKPVDAPNGSVFYEIDTSSEYLYDKENDEWLKQSGGDSLPDVTSEDNGKVLGVVSGSWNKVETLHNLVDGEAEGSFRSVNSTAEDAEYHLGMNASATGSQTKASGVFSHAEGYKSTASAPMAHAEGVETTASGYYSHTEGSLTVASGMTAHAEGDQTQATGWSSHAEGTQTVARGNNSHASGTHTQADGLDAFVIGKYNTTQPNVASDERGDYSFIIGNGTDENNRSNAKKKSFINKFRS